MIEICSYTEKEPTTPYIHMYSYCCPNCGCCDTEDIVRDEDLIETRTYFDKNRFWLKTYTMLPHKCLQCGNFYVVSDTKRKFNKNYLLALIFGISCPAVDLYYLITGVVSWRLASLSPEGGSSTRIIFALVSLLVAVGCIYELCEELTTHSFDRGLNKIVENLYKDSWSTEWENFDIRNPKHLIKLESDNINKKKQKEGIAYIPLKKSTL